MTNVNFVYSPSDNAIYPLELKQLYVNAGTWPNDTRPISNEIAAEFKNNVPDGRMMIAGDDGLPTWEDIPPAPPPTPEELQQIAESQKRQLMRVARDKIDIYQDAVDFSMAAEAEKSALVAWRKYRVELYQVDVSTAPDIQWPEQPK
ncbi:tail fiber assembly protein [Xenorhabdus littoralis]|uniref:tail fiber assembly protein n=1 Tax=Xenorhabdus littoralis TaxID=2582835 RepID=UPI0029E7D338|nr:tail fiber assembly protein [Xenorhabdus sp. psl]MDX7990854.1 tail fiber assembly protein [Xenorhabdus sp. psl]